MVSSSPVQENVPSSVQNHPMATAVKALQLLSEHQQVRRATHHPQKLSTKLSTNLPSHLHPCNLIHPFIPEGGTTGRKVSEINRTSTRPTNVASCWWACSSLQGCSNGGWDWDLVHCSPSVSHTSSLCLRLSFPSSFPSCRWLAASIVSLTGPVQTTELGTTFQPPICQRLFIRSKACS